MIQRSSEHEIIEVVVWEKVYSELEKVGRDPLFHEAKILKGAGEYGTYSGIVYQFNDDRRWPCGFFDVQVQPGEYFPEVVSCSVNTSTPNALRIVKDLEVSKTLIHACNKEVADDH